jgi:DNA-binding NarL/FixJ family response regulator
MSTAAASELPNPAPVRVLIVDDHPLVRDGFAAVLERMPGLEIVGTTGQGASGVRMVESLQPDVLLLDLGLPDQSGIEVARRVRASWPDVAVIVVTGYSVRNHSRLLTQLGVRGIVHKSAPSDQLVSAIHAAAEGRCVPDSRRPEPSETLMADPLTVREHEVLALVAAGLRNSEIATELHVSINTVEFHMRNLLSKLGARSRTEAIGRARTLGYTLPDDAPFH